MKKNPINFGNWNHFFTVVRENNICIYHRSVQAGFNRILSVRLYKTAEMEAC